MSEYQYYEFQAVDRPLTTQQRAELRALSTRATITSTRFTNVYQWGNFRGDPALLMERYFDAFVYVTNWGTHEVMLRLPPRLLDPATAARYGTDEGVHAWATPDHVIVAFRSEDERGDDTDEGEGWLPSLLPLRAELAGGDLRGLYLGWLGGVQAGDLEEDALEPPLPPGLGTLSGALQALADFLRLDADLLAVAAAPSAPSPRAARRARNSSGGSAAWPRRRRRRCWSDSWPMGIPRCARRCSNASSERRRLAQRPRRPRSPVAGRWSSSWRPPSSGRRRDGARRPSGPRPSRPATRVSAPRRARSTWIASPSGRRTRGGTVTLTAQCRI